MVGCRKNVTRVLGHHGNSMCSPSGLVVKPSSGGRLKRKRFDRLQVICYLFPFSEEVRRWDQRCGQHVNTICSFENNYYEAVLHIFSGKRRPQGGFLELGVGSAQFGRINGISFCRFSCFQTPQQRQQLRRLRPLVGKWERSIWSWQSWPACSCLHFWVTRETR